MNGIYCLIYSNSNPHFEKHHNKIYNGEIVGNSMNVNVVLRDQSVQSIEPFRLEDLENFQIACVELPNYDFVKAAERRRLNINEFSRDGRSYCVVDNDIGLVFSEEPKVSRSGMSQAVYVAERDSGENSLLLQYLPMLSRTSCHEHLITTEDFCGLFGYCNIHVKPGKLKLEHKTITVVPGQIHQLRTEESPSIALIVMKGNPDGLVMGDHYYHDDCIFD